MSTTAIDTLQRQFRGTVIGRDHPLYDEARSLYNGMIDKRPLLILRCADVADVIAAVRFAREQDLLLAIRGGGHNGPGLGSCDDGVVDRPLDDEKCARRRGTTDRSRRSRMHVR